MTVRATTAGSDHLRVVDTPAATWVGEVEFQRPIEAIRVSPRCAEALLVVTVDGVPAGRVRMPLVDGGVSGEHIRAAITEQLDGALHDVAVAPAPVARPITVVVATRNRPDSLARCVASLLRSDHPGVDVLVVDNDPADGRTEAVVRGFADDRVRYVREDRRGTSNGRNRGLVEAARTGGLVAFTDDDVEVDARWAGRMAAALSVPGVACVGGPVFAARLDTPAQVAADDALGWRKGYARRRFSLAEPPSDSAVFPFSPGMFGVGANMAVDGAVALALGGFDPALGPGTPTRGGEDCDFMIRLVLGGYAMAYEPSAYVWHHHRPTREEFQDQLDGYALGLGGFLTKILLDPVARAAAVRRIPAALAALGRIRARQSAAKAPGSPVLTTLIGGPLAYLRARRAVRRAGGTLPAFARQAVTRR